jgi:hypothetical protein
MKPLDTKKRAALERAIVSRGDRSIREVSEEQNVAYSTAYRTWQRLRKAPSEPKAGAPKLSVVPKKQEPSALHPITRTVATAAAEAGMASSGEVAKVRAENTRLRLENARLRALLRASVIDLDITVNLPSRSAEAAE